LSSQSVVLLIMGVSGSGKSLIGAMLAKRLGFSFIDADHYHTPDNKTKMSKGISLTDEDRIPWLQVLAELINEWIERKENGIIACSALKDEYRKIILAKSKHNYILYLKGDYKLIANRLAKRKHEFMNPNLLSSQFNTLEEPQNAICLDAGFPPEQIVEYACLKIKEAEKSKGRFFNCSKKYAD
jgi:gluconokinase